MDSVPEHIIAPVKEEMQSFENVLRSDLICETAEMKNVIDYVLDQKGKRLRPLLVFLSAAATGEIGKDTFTGASAIEMLHSATIIHDDIVDESDMRRGRKSVKACWNSKVAVLAGDFLLARALSTITKNKLYDFLDIMTVPICKMCEGELLQIEKSYTLDTSEETYFEIIEKKTAALIAASMSIGAKSAGADEESTQIMLKTGKNLGLAFQIKDDIFDYKKTNIIGKPIGNDIVERKITLPFLHSLSKVGSKDRMHMLGMVKHAYKNRHNISVVRNFVIENKGLEYSESVAREYCYKAGEFITRLKDSPAKKSLLEITEYMIERNK